MTPTENPYQPPPPGIATTQGLGLSVDPVPMFRAARPAIIFLSGLAGVGSVTHFLQFCRDFNWLSGASWDTAGYAELNVLWLLVMVPLYGYSSLMLWKYSASLRRMQEHEPAAIAAVSIPHTRAWNAVAIATGAKFVPLLGDWAYSIGAIFHKY